LSKPIGIQKDTPTAATQTPTHYREKAVAGCMEQGKHDQASFCD